MTQEQYNEATNVLGQIEEKKNLREKVEVSRIDHSSDFPDLATEYKIAMLKKIDEEIEVLEKQFAGI